MSDLLAGIALVSGGGSGIGRATCLAFVKHGIRKLAILDIDPTAMRETKNLILTLDKNVDIIEVVADMSDENAVIGSIQKVVERFERIDIAVNNVGAGGTLCASVDMSVEAYRKVLDLNLIGLWVAQREEIKQMLKQEFPEKNGIMGCRGVIVNLSSTYGLVAPSAATPAPPYIASKHGVVGMTKMDANSYAKDGLRINAICPGFVNTVALRAAVDAGGVMKKELEKVPMGRLAETSEIAEAISFLASPMSSYMTGACLVVDGGFLSQ